MELFFDAELISGWTENILQGSKPQGAQQQDDNKISQTQRSIRLFAEKADQQFKLTGCQKLRDRFFDFRIG